MWKQVNQPVFSEEVSCCVWSQQIQGQRSSTVHVCLVVWHVLYLMSWFLREWGWWTSLVSDADTTTSTSCWDSPNLLGKWSNTWCWTWDLRYTKLHTAANSLYQKTEKEMLLLLVLLWQFYSLHDESVFPVSSSTRRTFSLPPKKKLERWPSFTTVTWRRRCVADRSESVTPCPTPPSRWTSVLEFYLWRLQMFVPGKVEPLTVNMWACETDTASFQRLRSQIITDITERKRSSVYVDEDIYERCFTDDAL